MVYHRLARKHWRCTCNLCPKGGEQRLACSWTTLLHALSSNPELHIWTCWHDYQGGSHKSAGMSLWHTLCGYVWKIRLLDPDMLLYCTEQRKARTGPQQYTQNHLLRTPAAENQRT